jgi:hypothetical protein
MTLTLARLAPLVLALALAGCMSARREPTVVQLPPQPTVPVQQAQLPPPTPAPEAPIAREALPEEPQVAAAAPPPPAASVTRTDLLGGWAVSSGGQTCQLFMSLTQWTGGYRASTRGCSDPTLAGISAWDLNGGTVTLKGGDGGAPVATLAAASATNFNGTTVGGAPISVTR